MSFPQLLDLSLTFIPPQYVELARFYRLRVLSIVNRRWKSVGDSGHCSYRSYVTNAAGQACTECFTFTKEVWCVTRYSHYTCESPRYINNSKWMKLCWQAAQKQMTGLWCRHKSAIVLFLLWLYSCRYRFGKYVFTAFINVKVASHHR